MIRDLLVVVAFGITLLAIGAQFGRTIERMNNPVFAEVGQ